MTTVAVVGGSDPSEAEAADALEVGRLLGERGCVVVTGGRGGVMEAASRGAASAGAVVVGLLPGLDVAEANAWVSVAIPTGLGDLRNALVARAGVDGIIAVGGAYGTLSEVALALVAGRRVVGLRFAFAVDGVHAAPTPADAVSHLLG